MKEYGFIGAHFYPHWFELAPDHARWYPFYAKCVELDVPVQMQVGQSMLYDPAHRLRSVGRPITLETTQEVLHDLLRANDRRISIEDIQKHVATHYNIKVSDMHSARRSRAVARPRQVAMYLAKKLTSKSLPEIGRKFGGKDHTTVMHAVKRVEELMASDSEMARDVELIERIVQS